MSPRNLESDLANCNSMAEIRNSIDHTEHLTCPNCGTLVPPPNSIKHDVQAKNCGTLVPLPNSIRHDTEKKYKEKCRLDKLSSLKAKCTTDSDSSEKSGYYCMKDFSVQSSTMEKLEICNWFYEDASSQLAKKILHKKPIGTFLVRNSSDPNYLYAISVKTSRGTTSVRILYQRGLFQLDCDEKLRQKMPKFDCVVKLIDFYVRLGRVEKNSCRWLESSGRKDLPVVLKKPQVHSVPDLKQLCRISIVGSLPMTLSTTQTKSYIDKLPLPNSLKDDLKWYPFLH